MTDSLRNWLIALTTLILVLLYGAILLGWLKPLSDAVIITRLEPVIFLFIGYFLSRLPSQKSEGVLKELVERQTSNVDAARQSREQTIMEREELEEKIKNVITILSQGLNKGKANKALEKLTDLNVIDRGEALECYVSTAINVLKS